MSRATMRAVIFNGKGNISVEDREVPCVRHPTDAIVKVGVSALCGSDLHWYRGHQQLRPGFIPGHEFAGVIHELGSDAGHLKVGDAVVATFTSQCGECFYCKKKQTSRCEQSFLFGNSAGTTSIDGGQAEFVLVPYAKSTLVQRPTTIPENMAILMADIFPTGYFCASRFLKTLPASEASTTHVVVVGCGPVGICAIAAASAWCDNIFAVDMVPDRLAEAERLGAVPVPLNADTVSSIQKATQGRGADVVLEVVGSLDAMNMCIDMVRPFGCISSVGVQTQDLTFPGPKLYAKNVTIAWGRCPVRGIFEEALESLVKVQEKISFLCDTHMALEDAPVAYKLFDARMVHKVLFDHA